MYVLVENIDTTDTKKVEVLVMAEVEVVIPYLTWYERGGKAYSVIRTRVEKRVRSEFEKYSLLQLIQDEKSQDEAEKELTKGVPNCLDLGVKVNTVTIVEWDWKADDAFMKLLEDPKVIEAKEKAILRDQDLQQAQAERELVILKSKIEAAKATEKLSDAQWKSVLARFGGNDELARISMIKGELTAEEFDSFQLATALAKTSVTALGGDFMNIIKPKPTKE
jgi:regulator of protease activity HflC (stomatin/prohibitin superfamily)